MRSRRRFFLCTAFGFALTLTGCGGGGGSHGSNDPTRKATVNIYHTLVTNGGETGAIDIVVNRKDQGSDVAYLDAARNRTLTWIPPSGDQYVQLTRSGDSSAVLLQTALIFDPNDTYSLFIVGETNPTDATRRPSIVVLPRDTGGLASGRFRLRFIHALAGTGPVDVTVEIAGKQTKLVANLPFREGTSYGDIPLAALPLRVILTPAGVAPSPNPSANLIDLTYTSADFKEGKVYTEALVHRLSDASSPPTILTADH